MKTICYNCAVCKHFLYNVCLGKNKECEKWCKGG
jgi:hypothetical protein